MAQVSRPLHQLASIRYRCLQMSSAPLARPSRAQEQEATINSEPMEVIDYHAPSPPDLRGINLRPRAEPRPPPLSPSEVVTNSFASNVLTLSTKEAEREAQCGHRASPLRSLQRSEPKMNESIRPLN